MVRFFKIGIPLLLFSVVILIAFFEFKPELRLDNLFNLGSQKPSSFDGVYTSEGEVYSLGEQVFDNYPSGGLLYYARISGNELYFEVTNERMNTTVLESVARLESNKIIGEDIDGYVDGNKLHIELKLPDWYVQGNNLSKADYNHILIKKY